MNRGLLFIGVSSMKDHAGQDKLYFIADILGKQGIPVTLLVPDLEDNKKFLSNKPHLKARYYTSGSAFADSKTKSKIINEGGWSAAWVVGVGLRSFIWRRGAGTRIAIIKDFDEFPSMAENLSWWRKLYLQLIERTNISQADGFTCASSFLEDAIRAKRSDLGHRILRLRVAISIEEHSIDSGLVRRLRDAAQGDPIILYVGTISKMYASQLNELIELACVLRDRNSSTRLRIAGSGADLKYFKMRAEVRGVGERIDFCGHVRRHGDLSSHMEAASVLIFPFPANAFNVSRCPTKAFHYAAANRPVVTNRTGEVAALFGSAALYYPEGDVEALADCVARALELSSSYNNNIPFASLTWEARAAEFKLWLESTGWLSRQV